MNQLNNIELLATLNANKFYDTSTMLNNFIHTDDDLNIFSHINLTSSYHNFSSLQTNYGPTTSPLLLSINIQSLQSKFSNLVQLIQEINTQGFKIDVIALQETWNVDHPEMYNIPGFHPLLIEKRSNNKRGGGCGLLH
jgi:hypothetical protein